MHTTTSVSNQVFDLNIFCQQHIPVVTEQIPLLTMADRTCHKCGKLFTAPCRLKTHLLRKTPCDPILDTPEDATQVKPHMCRYCGRGYSSTQAMHRHMRKSCKIAGSEEGMEKLVEHTLRKQLAAQEAKMEDILAQNKEQSKQMTEMAAMMKQMMSGQMVPAPAPAVQEEKQEKQEQGVGVNNGVVIQNQTKQDITFNIFGAENLEHVTRASIAEIMASLKQFSAGDAAIQALLQTAMLIFSDKEHPENITCYMPNKKRKEAMIYSALGWEIKPSSLVLPPMMQKSVDVLFDKQPIEGVGDTPLGTDMDACGQILKELERVEKDPQRVKQMAGNEGELKAVLVRNKDQLQALLQRLPGKP